MGEEKLKKEYSYTYWKRDLDAKSAVAAASPQKIDSPLAPTASKFGKSAWNSANTWEERDISADLSGKLGRYLVEWFDSQSLPLTDVENDEARASICIVRGKPRMGFELAFSGTLKSGGTFKCREFCDYDDSFDLEVTDAPKAAVGDALSKLRLELSNIYMNELA
eukprot:Gregarina_sp_Pseudo_9__3499@NODE_3664_length_589_cov_18_789091_g3352_i0_p1_GENE_NODE_3664_length_589_cov_18_789091_g3352_i0NODE_3664_length_589_cov_18_789091_g3352_i0_p1_ORF_typecomplete_len165_score30_57Aha1_N/PF09229_11/0_00062_NODE_3664_length_589_cov_18_789091_g3352_i037531